MRNKVVVVGAGPAGLTAALELSRSATPCTVLEADATVGGLSRTVEYNGFRFDIGGHRFFTKVAIISDLWDEILGDDFLTRPRLSRIYYNQRFFNYPLKTGNVLRNLGAVESARCLLSYLRARIAPVEPETCFEDWVVNRFGERLYRMFFKSYTEKVWGISCREIQAEWAAQRIRGLSMLSAIRNALLPAGRNANGDVIKTLVEYFRYPRHGPGMLWNRVAEIVKAHGGKVHLQAPVTRIRWRPGHIVAMESGERTYSGDHFLSSMPIRDFVERLDPAPPHYLTEAARGLNYRDFLTVAIILRRRDVFPDNWIYVHDPGVKVGRIQNYKNWSPEMCASEDLTCLGLEYFCFEEDGLWASRDDDLIRMAGEELQRLGIARKSEIAGGTVVRVPKAYPVYDSTYRNSLATIREFLDRIPNLQFIGRNGMHHYNNQDHSMLTGLLAARNILGANYDLWQVNVDDEYLEGGSLITAEELNQLRNTQPLVPQSVLRHAAGED
jgi:protoporphyrinogen oxidase